MGNPSSHASHLASQWLKNRVLLIYLNSFLLTYPKHISAPGLLVSVIRNCLDSPDICLTQCTQNDPRIWWLQRAQTAEAQALLSQFSDVSGVPISTNHLKFTHHFLIPALANWIHLHKTASKLRARLFTTLTLLVLTPPSSFRGSDLNWLCYKQNRKVLHACLKIELQSSMLPLL